VPAFFLTVTLGETLGLFQKIFMQTESPYKTMEIRGGKQFFRSDFNLKTKPGKAWVVEKPCDKGLN
jgi:hypothetical protein